MEMVDSGKQKNNPADQPVGRRLMSKRLQMVQHEQIVHQCSQIEELCIVFANQLDACRQMDAPVGIILIEIANFDELENSSEQGAESAVSEIAKHILTVVRSQDMVARYNDRCLAVLMADADQVVGARVCQRIKECIQKFAYFHPGVHSIELEFGVADDSESRYLEIEALVFSAARALNRAHELGAGAIVRTCDLNPLRDVSPREHFFPGDRLTSKSE